MSQPRRLNVGLVQMACDVDPARNVETAVRLVRDAAAQGAQVILLPEMYRSRYFCQTEDHAFFKLAETLDGPPSSR
jgi:N-carbamoylputrescine amidase